MYTASGNHYLPIEVQRDIISRLELSSLKALRLASKTLATIGAEYLLPEVHLLYRSASLEHLGLISRHPIISQHVTSLFYEADRLNSCCYEDWYDFIDEDFWRDRCPLIPAFAAATDLWAQYVRDPDGTPVPGLPDDSLPHSYATLVGGLA